MAKWMRQELQKRIVQKREAEHLHSDPDVWLAGWLAGLFILVPIITASLSKTLIC